MTRNWHTFLRGAGWLVLPMLLSGLALAFLGRQLDIAPELSDNGYYILNTVMPQSIENQLAMFGVLWYSFFGPLPLIVSRAIYLILIYLSGAILGWVVSGALAAGASWVRRSASAICAGAAMLFIYYDARLDANYNGMVLMFFIAAVLCARPFLQPVTPDMVRFAGPFAPWGIGFGASMMAVALTKVSSAALMTVWFLAVLVAVHWIASSSLVRRKEFLKLLSCLIGWSLLGCAGFIGWLWVTVFSPTQLAERFVAGLDSTSLMGGHSVTVLDTAGTYWSLLSSLFDGYVVMPLVSLTILAPLGVLLIVRQRPEQRIRVQVVAAVVVILSGILTSGVFLDSPSSRQLFQYFGVLRVHALALALLCIYGAPWVS